MVCWVTWNCSIVKHKHDRQLKDNFALSSRLFQIVCHTMFATTFPEWNWNEHWGRINKFPKTTGSLPKYRFPINGILKQFYQVIRFELGHAAFIKQLQVEQGVPRKNLVFNAVNKVCRLLAYIIRHATANDVSVWY